MMQSTFERRRAFNLSPKNSEFVFEEMLDETLFILKRYAFINIVYTNTDSRTYIIISFKTVR